MNERTERGTYKEISIAHEVAVRNGWICRVEHGDNPDEYVLRWWGKIKN